MPSTRDLLQRFRPAGAPGAATTTGVPADRLEERDAELDPVFALLDDAVAEASRVRQEAAAEAELRRRRGRAVAAARVASARLDAVALRAELLARAEQEAHTSSQESAEAARATAGAISERARRSLDADVADVVARVRALLLAGVRGAHAVTASWVAGSVRAEAMARRRYGAAAARSLAATPTLDEALAKLVGTPFGHDVHVGQSLGVAQRAVAATVLWHLRVLAGWTPWAGTPVLRVVAGGYEIANVDGLVRSLHGSPREGPSASPYRLGALATSWPQLERARSIADLRARLATSPWGDPGQDTASAIQVGMRLALAHRAGGQLPTAWSRGGAAVLVARERFAAANQLRGPPADIVRLLLGDVALSASSLPELARALPRDAAWVLEGVEGPDDLWRAEAAWWRRVENDGFHLLRGGRFESWRLVGAAAVLCVDAWRVRAALEVAARGGTGLEVFDDVA